ncbi:MAG TPA: Ig-like domain-containing protein [Albitalea sp.]|uniref:Ig-like domain-containing protein n=1 Tax=Piscinibacter sp. TaxID=1903157 RepID=UPI002ED4E248
MRAIDVRRLLTLLLWALSLSLIAPDAALAATKKKAAPPSPQISSFEMEPAEKIAAGNELFFRVQGTPGSWATVRIGGVTRTVVLQEVDDGVYEGSYTLRRVDRAGTASNATATLRRSGRSATSTMARLNTSPPQAVITVPQPAPAQPLALNRFSTTPVDRLEPGTELRFVVEGTPGAKASFSIENVATGVPMREAASGRYEGSYTLKRGDRVAGGAPVVAVLEANGQTARSTLARSALVADARPPTVRNQVPRDNETVQAGGPVTVSGSFSDAGGLGVDPRTVRIVVGGRDVTSQASISRESFSWRSELAPGQYVADVTARDGAGNPVRSAWTFNVAQAPTAAVAVGIPLSITSPAPNTTVPAGTRFTVRGKTAPFANVDAEVLGITAAASAVGLVQKLYNDRLTADANGDFSFDVAPQTPVPGMRYEVMLKANANNQTKDTRLVLFQQR